MPLLFVYGTLKRGGGNHRQLANQEFVGAARTVPGYRLFDLGDYPGMVTWPADNDGVTGEIWSVDPAALSRLDVFEGVNLGLYQRAFVRLLPPFADHTVESYLYLKPIAGRTDLGSTWAV